MSLATRCTACGTVFRVVQDQLKISEGWVRCGRCKEVFNALEGLFDLDRETPPPWQPPVPTPVSAPMPLPGAASVDVPLPDDDAPAPVDVVLPDAPAEAPRAAAAPVPESAQIVDDAVSRFGELEQADEKPEFADARFDTSTPAAEAPAAAVPNAYADAADAEPPPAAPAFLRQAQRRARWESPAARALLSLAAAALLLLLAGQGAYQFRDTVAAQWPQTRVPLDRMCSWLGCTVGPLHRIEDIAVESSTLARAGGDAAPDALRLSIALRNRGSLTLAMPTIDLTLTDSSGEIVARRALYAADFPGAGPVLAPLSEANLQLLFATDRRRVAGYTVEIFYP